MHGFAVKRGFIFHAAEGGLAVSPQLFIPQFVESGFILQTSNIIQKSLSPQPFSRQPSYKNFTPPQADHTSLTRLS